MPTQPKFFRPLVSAALLLALAQAAQADDWVYTAHEGDNLYDLAGTYTKRQDYWRAMQTRNHIGNPRKIPPGTKIHIPVDWLRFEPAPVRVLQTFGDCQVIPANGVAQPAQAGMELHTGDQIRTGVESTLSLQFADGSRVLVRAQSEMTLDSISAFGEGAMVDSRLRLRQGALDSQIVPARAGIAPRFRIHTPSAVAAVRGTDFRVSADADAATRNETLQGTVEVEASGAQRRVPAGFGVVAGAGRPPQAPRKLLPAPELDGLSAVVEDIPVELSWPALKNGAGYRAQVAPNARFDVVVADRRATQANAQFGDLPDGDYVLRVRGIDAAGLEGLDGTHAFTVNARPEPPVAAAPHDGGNVYTPRPKFWWSKPAGAEHYHFQLAADADFSQIVADLPEVDSAEMDAPQDLVLGRYYWRVATVDATPEQGPYGVAQSFTVNPALAAPQGPEAALAEEAITFKWKAVQDATRYQFQLAEDEAFSEELLAREVPENSITLTKEELDSASGGEHFFRIRSVAADGSPGAWSAIHAIDLPSKISPLWLLTLTLILIPILL